MFPTTLLVIAALISFLIFVVFTGTALLFHNTSLAFCLASLTIVFLFTFRWLYNPAMAPDMAMGQAFCFFLGIGAFVCWLFLKKKYHFKKPFVIIVAAASLLLFLFNMAQAVPLAVKSCDVRDLDVLKDSTVWNFRPDRDLPSPNIYWIHCDGMLGFDAFEKYYHDGQPEFRKFLSDRGFYINPKACFEAFHQTNWALVCLMCPMAYDSLLSSYLVPRDKAGRLKKPKDAGMDFVLSYLRLCRNELYNAFLQKGYHLYFIPDDRNTYLDYFPSGRVELEKINFSLRIGEFLNTVFGPLGKWFPLRLYDFRPVARQLPDSNSAEAWPRSILHSDYGGLNASFLNGVSSIPRYDSPRLVIIKQFGTHAPYVYDASGKRSAAAGYISDPLRYPAQHRFISSVTEEVIRVILRSDPDAVIVLQGDHGLHMTKISQFHSAFGSSAVPKELWNSGISAVRIPEKYRRGNEKYLLAGPLNITRYIINSFVRAGTYKYVQ